MATEPGKHAKRSAATPAAPPPRVSNLPGGRALAAIVGTTLTLALVLWLVWAPWSGGDEPQPAPVPTPLAGPSYGVDWTTADGSSYRMSVVPARRTSSRASAGGCVPAPGSGRRNVGFTVRLENRGEGPAPVPSVEIGSNLGPRGTVSSRVPTLARSNRSLELAPLAEGQGCADASTLGSEGRPRIGAGRSVEFLGTIGDLLPAPDGSVPGLTLVVLYHPGDPASPGGSAAQEFLVPFDLDGD